MTGVENVGVGGRAAALTAVTTLLLTAGVVALLARSSEAPAPEECTPARVQPKQRGTQGFRIWQDETFHSFHHGGDAICVPPEWEPVGETLSGRGWARFPARQTGVLVRRDSFDSTPARFDNTPFEVEIVWPRKIALAKRGPYLAMIENAFVRVGKLYPRLPARLASRHTVLVTARVGGSTKRYEERIYPEPGPNLSVVVRTPDQWRAHELFIHAVAHLYNRHRPYWIGDQKEKLPVPRKDWEELVATWTESAFIPRQSGRKARLGYLYRVHTAVQTGNFSLITGPPFNDRDAFEKIRRDVIVRPGQQSLDFHYGHYILAPLSMMAIQGLLLQLHEAGKIESTGVEELLTEVHAGRGESFLALLWERLPPAEAERVRGWMHEGRTIPRPLIDRAIAHYAKQFPPEPPPARRRQRTRD